MPTPPTDVTGRIGQIDRRIRGFTAPLAHVGSAPGTVLGGEVANPARSAAAVTFDRVYQAARTGAATTTAVRWTPTGTIPTATTTGMSAELVDGVPAELAAYGNGRIPTDALAPIGVGSHRLWAPAAAAFTDMVAAAAADGITIGVTDSYRSYAAQVDVAERKGLYINGGLAAVPGTSKHGWGKAVDLDLGAAAQQWMRTHGPAFGFVENVPREPWHWEWLTPAER